MNYSLTWTSAIVFFLVMFLKGAGFDADEASITEFVMQAAQIITAIGIFWGRYRQGDISVFGKKVAK